MASAWGNRPPRRGEIDHLGVGEIDHLGVGKSTTSAWGIDAPIIIFLTLLTQERRVGM